MSPLEQVKSWLTEMAGNGHPKSFYSTLLRGVVEKISELEAAEEKPRPDSAGVWWRVGWTTPRYLSENAIKSLSVQLTGRWIKAHKPEFSKREQPELKMDEPPHLDDVATLTRGTVRPMLDRLQAVERDVYGQNGIMARLDKLESAVEWCSRHVSSLLDDASEPVPDCIKREPAEPEVSDEPPPMNHLLFGRYEFGDGSCSDVGWWRMPSPDYPRDCWQVFKLLPNEHQDLEQARKWLEEVKGEL